jgi:hypothetical protein
MTIIFIILAAIAAAACFGCAVYPFEEIREIRR